MRPRKQFAPCLAFLLAGFTAPAAQQKPEESARTPEPAGMHPAWAIRLATDEVLKLAAQFGVRDIIVYGGPGAATLPGTATPLAKPRAGLEDYLALRRRLESHGLRLAAFEGGFVHLPKYHDVVFGGPKRDELIAELISEIRDMARAGVPVYGYHWMPALVWRTPPATIRGGAQATAFDFDLVKDIRDRASCETFQSRMKLPFIACANLPETPREVSEQQMWENLEHWIRKVTPVAEREGIRLGIHPDDPPVEAIAGVPRLFRNHAAYRRLI